MKSLLHVVLISFYENTVGDIRQWAYDRYQTLSEECGGKDAGILFWKVDWNLDLRKNVHLVEIAIFENNEALQKFRAHPKHKALTDILRNVADWQVGDIDDLISIVQASETLDAIGTDILAQELYKRITKENLAKTFLSNDLFNIKRELSIIPCVDAFPVRWRDLQVPEIGLIIRNTGFYKGRWWCIGGILAMDESIGTALKRHVRETLGVDFELAPGLSWNTPAYTIRYFREPERIMMEPTESLEFLGHDPSKEFISSTYLIDLESDDFVFGATAHGGQEASDFRWFPVNNLPSKEEIAYGGEQTVIACATWALKNLREK